MFFNPCCCCKLFYDDFSANTISRYSIVSGTWSITGGKLTVAGSNSILLINDIDCKDNAMSVNIGFSTPASPPSFDEYIMICRYVDSDNYVYAKMSVYNPLFTNYCIAKIYKRVAGVETQIAEANWNTLMAGYPILQDYDDVITLSLQSNSSITKGTIYTAACSAYLPGGSGGLFGIGTKSIASATNIAFDELTVWNVTPRENESDTSVSCLLVDPACNVLLCDTGYSYGVEVELTLDGFDFSSVDCDCGTFTLDGTYVMPYMHTIDSFIVPCVWRYEGAICTGFNLQLSLTINGSDELELTISSTDFQATYRSTATKPFDCSGPVELFLVAGSEFVCDGSAAPASCTVVLS